MGFELVGFLGSFKYARAMRCDGGARTVQIRSSNEMVMADLELDMKSKGIDLQSEGLI